MTVEELASLTRDLKDELQVTISNLQDLAITATPTRFQEGDQATTTKDGAV